MNCLSLLLKDRIVRICEIWCVEFITKSVVVREVRAHLTDQSPNLENETLRCQSGVRSIEAQVAENSSFEGND